MPKFRKRPVVIDAEQYWPGRVVPGVCLAHDFLTATGSPAPHVHTLEGAHIVSPGDWIITGIKGERYPCRADIFAATYEAYVDTESRAGSGSDD